MTRYAVAAIHLTSIALFAYVAGWWIAAQIDTLTAPLIVALT